MKRRRRRNPDALAIAKVGGAAFATVAIAGVGAFLGWFGPGFTFAKDPQARQAEADEETRIQLLGLGVAAAAAIAGAGEKPGTILRGIAYGGLAVAALPLLPRPDAT